MKKTNIQAVLWDFDGTLVNTADLHFKADEIVLSRYGYRIDRSTFDAAFGMSDHAILRAATPGLDESAFERLVDEKNRLYMQLALQTPLTPLPGVVQWLTFFQRHGLHQAIVSTTFAENIRIITEIMGIAPFFETVISTVGLNLPSKPAPDGFLKAAALVGYPPETCLVIEDAPAGVEAAKNAGMKCLAVSASYPLEKLQSAALVSPSLADIEEKRMIDLLGVQE